MQGDGADVGLTDSDGGVGSFGGGQRREPHEGRPLTQLEHPLSRGGAYLRQVL